MESILGNHHDITMLKHPSGLIYCHVVGHGEALFPDWTKAERYAKTVAFSYRLGRPADNDDFYWEKTG